MGLDTTIYRATSEHGQFFNPFAPPPPQGKHWTQVVEWRKNYTLTTALFPGHGSPDWKVLTTADVDNALGVVAVEAQKVAESLTLAHDMQGRMHNAMRLTAAVLREIRDMIAAGEVYMVEVMA